MTPRQPIILEFVRSGDRRQSAYSACSNALITLVMGELAEGKGRFIDQIINAVWYYSEQTWWGWSAHIWVLPESRLRRLARCE
ncbi:MAG: hypothetical protein MZV63_16245 [Marinilabiliales bacterium]|nr:hypothetical protein [Marinilabiliales bacterium]